jgi:endonuclease/exonuclease/phosphatase family metal-dependent hydrolase
MQVDVGFGTLVNTHLTAAWHTRDPETLRIQQAQALARHLTALPREKPLLLVGDFNCGAAEPPFAALRAVLPPIPNTQATWKDLVIDHVFFRGGRASVVQQSLHVEESNASDHKPVVLDLVMDLKTL